MRWPGSKPICSRPAFPPTCSSRILKQPELIQVQGTPPDRIGDVRNLLDSRYGAQYIVASEPNNSWTLTMKGTEVQTIEQHAMQQSIDTIGTRINALGVREPTIQEYNLGTNQILVELPGIDDLSRVREIIQSTARLEIHQVVGGPFPPNRRRRKALGEPFHLKMRSYPMGAPSLI